MMNEDLHRGRCNAEIGADGFIKIIEECEEEELFTRYGSKYNWDSIKQKALTGLITDIVNLFPGHESRITPEWSELKRKQDPISRWVRRVINGRTTSSERHGIICWKDEKGSFEEMIGYITYGPNTVRYNFKHWGQVLEQYGTKEMGKKSNLMNFWDGGDVAKGMIGAVIGLDGNVKARELLESKESKPRGTKGGSLNSQPTVNVIEGRIKITMDMGKKKLKERLSELKASKSTKDLTDKLRSLKIWRVSLLEKKSEDEVPGNGWCGYVAMNQIINNDNYASKMDDDTEIGKLKDSVDQIFKVGRGGMMGDWKKKSTSKLTPREVLLSVKETLSNWKGRLSSKLENARWMNSKNLYGTCGKWSYSQWGEDREDIRYCELRDSPMSQGSVTNHSEWRWIMRNNMLIGRDNHYYVRKGGMEQDYEVAFGRALEQATEDISNILWPNGGPSDDQDQSEGIDDNNGAEGGDEVIIVEKQRRGKSKPIKKPKGVEFVKTAEVEKLTSCHMEKQDLKDLAESGEKLEIINDTRSEENLGKLKIIFWNSNGWDTDRCDRIAALAKDEDADVVCIQDSRMDPHREQYLKGYMNLMEKVTGKKWKGKMVCRPGRRRGCMVGGSLLMTSHNCVDVRRVGILNYGVADKIDMKWRNEQITIIPTYRPCMNKAAGSLRTAMGNESEDFEERYWDSIRRSLKGNRIVWGGDFNLNRNDLRGRITGMEMDLLELEEGAYTYIAEVGGEDRGRVIDHVMVRGCNAESSVTEDGSFVRDHIPLVVAIEVLGKTKREGNRRKETYPTMIRAGDEGAKKKLEKAMKNIYRGN